MKDYSKAKIYKIVCNISGLVYVGSTCEPTLARRLAKHVGCYKSWKKETYHFVTSFKVIEGGNYDIVLLEEVKCETKDQLYARERYYIESLDCVNKIIPTRTQKESTKLYREEHQEYFKKYSKKYREEHNDELKAKKNLGCSCICGKTYTNCHKSRHERTPYHQNYLKSQNEINDDNLPCSLDGLELESN